MPDNFNILDQPTGSGSPEAYVYIRDEKPSGTNGGVAAAGINTRVLNTKVNDASLIAILVANQITLTAGTYRVRASAPGWAANLHKARLRNVSSGVTLFAGTCEQMSGTNVQTRSFVAGRFTVAAGQLLELQHWFTTPSALIFGLGVATASGDIEVYSEIEFWREN